MLGLVLLVVLGYVNAECPEDWSQFKDSCYKASSTTAYSWKNAQEDCKRDGSYLAEIGDRAENDFVARMTFGAGTWFFIGIVHNGDSEEYVKASSGAAISYSNWRDVEDNKVAKPKCTKLGYLGFWESFPCDEEQYFICESEKYISRSQFGGWLSKTHYFTYKGHHYRTVGRKATFQEAKEMCEKAGGYLVEPDDEEENVFVHDKMHVEFFGRWRFIGGNDYKHEGIFVWGKKEKPLTFKNWWPGEPNNKYNEDCMEMRYWGKWNDVSCYSNKRFICERSVDGPVTDSSETDESQMTKGIETTTEYYDYMYY